MLLLRIAILLLMPSTVPAPAEIISDQPDRVEYQKEKSGRELLYQWLKESQKLNWRAVQFHRFSYHEATRLERSGEGTIRVANGFRWRIDILPDQTLTHELGELADGETLLHKIGDVQYEVVSESHSTYMREYGNLHHWKNDETGVIPESYAKVTIANSVFDFEPANFVIPTILKMFIDLSSKFPLAEQKK